MLKCIGGSIAVSATSHQVSALNAQEVTTEEKKDNGPVEAEFERDYDAPGFKPSWSKPQVNRSLAADFVIYAHSDLEMTKTA